MAVEIKTGCGRIVWGNPGKSQIKKIQDGPDKGKPVLKDGVPVNQWVFGVAFPKAEFAPIWAAMSQEAATGYPNGTPPRFAWKYQDGDSIDSNGQPFNKREGYAGCYVLTVSSEAFAPPIYKFQNGAYVQLTGDQIKPGDFVALALKFVVNVPPSNTTRTPSLYVNPVAIEHVGYGTEIQNGPDPMALFGGQQRQLPQGASATPIAPAHGVGMPGTNGGMPMHNPGMMQQPGQMPNGAPQPGYQQPAPGYTPAPDPRFTGGGMPGNPTMMHAPGGYVAPGGPGPVLQMPGQMPGPGHMQVPQHPHPGHVQPAHDFVHNAGQQMPNGPAPMVPPGYQQPQQYQQPGQMPGMMPPNR